jgi:hypothetical protein
MTDLPDFHIPHAEKIEWMIETKGWALDSVPARPEASPPAPGYTYTVGFPEAFGFPEVIVFGLTPAATSGLLDLVADLLGGGTEIPVDVELVGLFDNELRTTFMTVDVEAWGHLVPAATEWQPGRTFGLVQLLWPDRNGFLPTEAGFDRRVALAQPVIGTA